MTDSPHRPSARAVFAVLAATGLSVVLGAMRGGFFHGAPLGDDNSSHFAEIAFIAKLLRAGETDFWFDQTNLGYPLFLSYQPGPSLVMGALTALFESFVDPMLVFKLSILLVWALMPSAWYVGGRWLGMDRLTALVFGMLILSVHDFRSFGLGIASATSIGLYTQSYGTLLLPLAMGALYRYLFVHDLGLKAPTLLFSAALLAHAYFGLYLALGGGVMVLVAREGLVDRVRRLGLVFGVSALLTAFWTIPFMVYIDYQGGLPWRNESENGYPPLELARLAITGELFDHGRLPWITVLVALGIGLAWKRRTETVPRFALSLLSVTILLLLGRTTWGALYGLIPLHGELEVVRYLNGVHLCGLLLAAPVAAWLLRRVAAWMASLPGPAWLTPGRTTAAFLVAVVGGYWVAVEATSQKYLRSADEAELHLPALVAALGSDQSSRFLAHKRLGTGQHFYLNLVSALTGRPQLESFSRGYHDTLSLYYLEYFDFTEASFRMYNVGAALIRDNARDKAPEFLTPAWHEGEFSIYEYASPGGYFEFVRTPFALVGDLKEIRPVAAILSSRLFDVGMLPRIRTSLDPSEDSLRVLPGARVTLSRDGQVVVQNQRAPRVVSTLIRQYGVAGRASKVLEHHHQPNRYAAVVESAGAPERLLLKASFHPLWSAEVDGEPVEVDHVSPNLMAIDVPAGRHRVRFRYRNPTYQKVLFAGSVLLAILWWIVDATRSRRREFSL